MESRAQSELTVTHRSVVNGRIPYAESRAGDLQHVAEVAMTQLEAAAVILESNAGSTDPVIVAVGVELPTAEAISSVLAQAGVGDSFDMIESIDGDERVAEAFDWSTVPCASIVSVPLSWEGRDVGRLHVLGPRWARTARRQREVSLAVASHAALAVAFGRLHVSTLRRSQHLESLMKLDDVLLASDTLEQLGEALIAQLSVLGVPTGGLMVLDEEHGVLQLLPGSFGALSDETASYRVRIDNPVSNSARVFATGEPYLSNGAEGDPGIMQDYVDLFHVQRLLSVPLTTGDRRIGIFHLANKPTPFAPTDLYRAELLASRFGTVVELGLTMFRLRRQQQATDILVDLALGIASGKDIFSLARNAFERLGDVIGADVLVLAPPDGAPMVWKRDGISGGTVDELAEKAVKSMSLQPNLTEPAGAGDPGHAALFVPVRLAGKRIATVASMRSRAEPFVATEREVLVRLSSLAAVGWATENYQRQRVEVAILRDRQRIADDLHDTVAQIMFAAQIDLDNALDQTLSGDAHDSILHARSLLLRGDTEIRNVIHQLSRPMRGGLAQRLGLVAEAIEEEFGGQVSVRVEVPPAAAEASKTLRRMSADALVKAAQEAITNAAKHGGNACAITVRLGISRRGRIVLTVIDDGIGLGNRNGSEGYGISSVRRTLKECGGQLQVRNPDGGGTRVLASVPI